MKLLVTYLIGLIFGLGILISGMANPAKVLNFFDFMGIWDPSLGLVMAAAFIVAFIGYRIVFRRPAPIFGPKYHVPSGGEIDRSLVIGSAVFGIGWGISGFCPGGALPAIGTADLRVLTFVAALVVGMTAVRAFKQRLVASANT
jgi:uncharacterized membrane protein YedE/YeeE